MIRKLMWGTVLVALIIAGITLIDYKPVTATDNAAAIGKVTLVVGTVQVREDGNSNARRSYVNQSITSGHIVETSSRSKAVISLLNGSYLSLNSNTKVQLKDAALAVGGSNRQTTIGVLAGAARVFASQQAAAQGFNVSTPSSVAGVRGTEFLVGVGATGSSNIMVIEGAVEVIGSGSQQSGVRVEEKASAEVEINNNPTTHQQAEEIQEIDVPGVDGGRYKFAKSDELIEWDNGEEDQARRDPVGTLEEMNRRLTSVKDETAQLVTTVKDKTEEIADNAKDQGELNITRDEAREVRTLDRRMNVASTQNESLAILAENVRGQNNNNTQVNQQYQNIRRTTSEIDQMESQMDAFVREMEEEINQFVNDQVEAINDMVDWGSYGFEDEGGFDDDGGGFDGGGW